MLQIFKKYSHPGHGTHSSDEHAEVSPGHHVAVTDCGHRDQRPPQAWGQHFNNCSVLLRQTGGGGYSK